MNRFTQNRIIPLFNVLHIISTLFIIGFIILFIAGINSVENVTSDEQAKSLERAVLRSIAQCYAVEGTYPPSLDYIKKHYGLIYDENAFYIDYTAVGSNIMPDVSILPRS